MSAQSIVRSTLCGSGATWSNSAGSLTSTFGQCPGCGTLSSNGNILTQGFQQPSRGDTCFTIAVNYIETIDVCGTTYNFNYTGNADLATVELIWDFGPNGFPQTSSLAAPQGVSFSETGFMTINLQVIGGGCTKMTSFQIDVVSLGFSANPISNQIDCNGDATGSIQIEVNSGTAPFSYIWSTGQQTAYIEDLMAGDYVYSVTDANGCEATNVISLSEPATAISVDAFSQSETCEGDRNGSIEVTVAGGTLPYQIQWGNGEATPSLTNLTAGEYALTVTDAKDCTSELVLVVGQMCGLMIDDILSPNGDGANDTWTIQGINQFPENEVSIFNRWGQLIWHANAYNNDWEGTNGDGEILPIGAYFYVVKLNDPEKQVLSGSVTLVR